MLLVEKEIFSNQIVTEVKVLEKFYYAEEYHQNFERYRTNQTNYPRDPARTELLAAL
jgi:peptide methionine sulfoxide reductase MsrA